MPFSEIEIQHINEDIADFMRARQTKKNGIQKFNLEYRIYETTIDVYKLHFSYIKNHIETQETPIVRLLFSREEYDWNIYWMDLQWQKYNENSIKSLREALAIIATDKYGCFFG